MDDGQALDRYAQLWPLDMALDWNPDGEHAGWTLGQSVPTGVREKRSVMVAGLEYEFDVEVCELEVIAQGDTLEQVLENGSDFLLS